MSNCAKYHGRLRDICQGTALMADGSPMPAAMRAAYLRAMGVDPGSVVEPSPRPFRVNVKRRGGCGCGRKSKRTRDCPPLPATKPILTTPADVAARCQVIVKSFRRFTALRRFIDSVQSRYPGLEILIADDSFESGQPVPKVVEDIKALPGVRWFQMPFDSGLSAGRNLLVREATADVLILCDDDYIVTAETPLERFLCVLDADPAVSLVGGLVRDRGKPYPMNWTGTIQFTGKRRRTLRAAPIRSEWQTGNGVRYRMSDLVVNFFAARRESLLRVPWDDRLKIASEHMDFFVSRREAGEVTVYTPEVIATHARSKPEGYTEYRFRVEQFQRILKRKWGVKAVRTPGFHRECGEPPLPPVSVQAKNYAKAQVRHSLDGRVKLPAVESGIRIAVCETCEFFRRSDRRCSECGCYIDEKATWRSEDCPKGNRPKMEKPNIVVLGVGHSGTSIVAGMIFAMGWNGGDVDPEYNENRDVRELNERARRTQSFDRRAAERVLNSLPRPWAIKDPRFCEQGLRWIEAFKPHEPLLLWITRDPAAVEASYARRGEPDVIRGLTRPETLAKAAELYREWPWAKLMLPLEKIADAVKLFDMGRVVGGSSENGQTKR